MNKTPKESGYYFPAEFDRHTATWLSWPHKEASWPGKIDTIYPVYARFIKLLSEGERVNINVVDEAMRQQAHSHVQQAGADLSKVEFFIHPTNDAWCRDHGPAFLINPSAEQKKSLSTGAIIHGVANTHPMISMITFRLWWHNTTISLLSIRES